MYIKDKNAHYWMTYVLIAVGGLCMIGAIWGVVTEQLSIFLSFALFILAIVFWLQAVIAHNRWVRTWRRE